MVGKHKWGWVEGGFYPNLGPQGRGKCDTGRSEYLRLGRYQAMGKRGGLVASVWGGKRRTNKPPVGRDSRQQAGGKGPSQEGYRGRKA